LGEGGPGAGAAGADSDPGAQPGKAAGETERMEQDPGKAASDKAEPGKAEGTAKTKDKAPTVGEDAPTAAEDKAPTAAEATTDDKAGTRAKGEADADAKKDTSVKLDSQQVSKVKTYFSEHRPTVKAVSKTEVSVSVGVAVPTSIVLYDLPPDIIVIEGECQIKYFVWGEDIVLVDSCARVVVEIIIA